MRAIAKALKISAIALAMGLLSSCGSSNNDQGTSVTLTGLYAGSPCDVGLSGISIPLSAINAPEDGNGVIGGVIAALQVQNNLAATGFRVDRIDLSYEIPGSSLQPPSTAAPVTMVLAPAPSNNTGAESSLPPGFANAENPGCAEFLVLPNPIWEWLNLNRENIPEAPFQIFATITASGVSTSGDRINTNPASLFIDVSTDEIIPPTVGSEGGPTGTGGGNNDTGNLETSPGNTSNDDSGLGEGDTLPAEEGDSNGGESIEESGSEEQVE